MPRRPERARNCPAKSQERTPESSTTLKTISRAGGPSATRANRSAQFSTWVSGGRAEGATIARIGPRVGPRQGQVPAAPCPR